MGTYNHVICSSIQLNPIKTIILHIPKPLRIMRLILSSSYLIQLLLSLELSMLMILFLRLLFFQLCPFPNSLLLFFQLKFLVQISSAFDYFFACDFFATLRQLRGWFVKVFILITGVAFMVDHMQRWWCIRRQKGFFKMVYLWVCVVMVGVVLVIVGIG